MRALVFFFCLALSACGAPSSDASDPNGVAEADQDLARKKPIPFVLQYAGYYEAEGAGRVAFVSLNRDGSFAAEIDGKIRRGSFYGPSHVPTTIAPPAIVLVTTGLRIDAQVDPGVAWAPNDTLRVTFDGTTETLKAPWASGNESMCDATGGAWTDDDADPQTGLYCVCPAKTSYIPSAGGCVK